MNSKNRFIYLKLIFYSFIFITFSTQALMLHAKEKQDDNQRLNIFFDDVFKQYLSRSPMKQSTLGIKDDYDKWDDISEKFQTENLSLAVNNLASLRNNFDYEKLDEQSQLSYRLFEQMVESQIEGYRWRHHNYPVNQMFGLHSEIPAFLINIHQVNSVADAQAYIARLKGVQTLLRQLVEGLEIRAQKGVLPPKFVFPHVLGEIQNILTGAPFEKNQTDSPLLADFRAKLEALKLPEKQSQRLLAEAERALLYFVKPAYLALSALLKQQQKLATTKSGAWKLPNGDEYYRFQLRETTTTTLTPEEIHQYGLNEVDRIHAEMRAIMKQVGFVGTLQDFFQYVRKDSRFFYPDTDAGRQAYLDRSSEIIEQMKRRLDEVFNTKPEADIIVKAIEPYREKTAGWAFYMQPALDGSRPGIFYVNLYRMSDNPRYSEEALAYHEGIPGHHMQIAIGQELKNLPKFRTEMMELTAFVEGWGLYSEYLPKEMGGFYQDPYSDFGRLSMELWRAIRLVVDTGLHYKKWTREQTIEYQVQNAPAPPEQAIRATERYIVMPGQATAYKIGMRKILALREMARSKLGVKFNLGEYHDVVLTNGPLPLSVLEERVNHWVVSKN